MLAKAEQFLGTARMVIESEDHESSVSRAYYAVFHAIRALLDLGEPPESHPQIIDRCVRWNTTHTRLSAAGMLRGHKNLRSSLEALHRWRNQADYWVGLTSEERAKDAVDYARRFLAVVKEGL